MGNRFASLAQYHTLVKGHGIVAVITFLFIVPAAIMTARFYGRNPKQALRMHIYLQVMTILLSTVAFVLGWFAVGPKRSLTNPHHGIGVAIYVLIWVQAIGGRWVYGREKGRVRRTKLPLKLVLHQWLGRATAILAIVQVPLGLTLYGSPKFTFVLYTLWMTFLLVLYFILSYRSMGSVAGLVRRSSHGGTVIEEKRRSSFGWLGPLAAGAGAAALLSRNRNKSRSRSRTRREEVIPSRRGSRRDSESYIEDEKYESRKNEGGGMLNTVLKGAAILGAGALAKSWYDRRKEKKQQDEYSSVAPDTPSRRHRRRNDSISEDSVDISRVESRRAGGPPPSTPGPGDTTTIMSSAAGPRPVTPRPVRPGRAQSFDSGSYSYTDSLSPSRRQPSPSHAARNGILAGLGMGWLAKRLKDRQDRREQERLDRLAEEERMSRLGRSPSGPRYTGDGMPPPRRQRVSRTHEPSDLSSMLDDPHYIRPGGIPPIPPALAAGAGAAGAAYGAQPRGAHDLTNPMPPPPPGPPPGTMAGGPVSMPPAPPDPVGILHQDSVVDSYISAGDGPQRQNSSRRQQESEAAAAAAAAGAAELAAQEEARRQRSRSRSRSRVSQEPGQPVSLKVKLHGDQDQNITLRRLTEEEAAAEREARRAQRRRRNDSLSSLSGSEIPSSRRRYRRDRRDRDAASEAGTAPPPPAMEPLSPPNPAFAGGKRPKDSAYYSGRPEGSGVGGVPPSGLGSPDSHGTMSAMSMGSGSVDPAERRRRRRLERNQRPSGTVEFT